MKACCYLSFSKVLKRVVIRTYDATNCKTVSTADRVRLCNVQSVALRLQQPAGLLLPQPEKNV
jgi:hypothetical protein